VCLTVFSIYMSDCLSFLSICLTVCLFYLYIYLSVCLTVCLSISMPANIYLSIIFCRSSSPPSSMNFDKLWLFPRTNDDKVKMSRPVKMSLLSNQWSHSWRTFSSSPESLATFWTLVLLCAADPNKMAAPSIKSSLLDSKAENWGTHHSLGYLPVGDFRLECYGID